MQNDRIQSLYNTMLSNPQFIKFVEKNKHKSIEELATEYNIPLKEQDVQKPQYKSITQTRRRLHN